MTSSNKLDPVEILAKVGGMKPDSGGKLRAFEVWISLAGKAGWNVTNIAHSADARSIICGTVEVEGLEYRILYDRRVRRTVVDDSTGAVVIKPAFGYAAWAEPIVVPD